MGGTKDFGLTPKSIAGTAFDELVDEPLLLLAPPASVSGYLLRVLEQDFAQVAIIPANQMEADLRLRRHRARDVLFSAEYSDVIFEISSTLRRYLPYANKTLIYDDRRHSPIDIRNILSSDQFDNVVNINANSDVLSSIFKIISAGGEYICPTVIRNYLAGSQKDIDQVLFNEEHLGPTGNSEELQRKTLAGLTHRELEILEMVAHGYRNKAIADELSLSEHTVKVHLRNIIKKLGAYNRTNAAAMFHLGSAEREN